jgi:hypothetical protein
VSDVKTMPVQIAQTRNLRRATLREEVVLRAYEVYCHLWGPQAAMITGSCRGGYGVGELTAFLYARSFPKEEWRARVDEAFEGMNL